MKRVLIALFISAFVSIGVMAQTTGKLTGTVNGPDGVLPGANITVRDNQTGKETTVQSSGNGSFLIPQLEFGTYTVTIKATGFKTYSVTDLKVDVGREYSLSPTLEVGSVEAIVTVQAGADIINSTSAELSSTVSRQQILDLPLNGRNPLALINLQAGANATSASINGQRSSTTNYTRDGISIQDNFIRAGGFVSEAPSVDDTDEFTLVTQNGGAELGNGGSAQVQLVTPRGGSDFHGSLFEFNRNSEFSANTFFNNSATDPATGQGVQRSFLNRNQYGGRLSGPMPFLAFGDGGPAMVKDKAFFFFAYESLKLRQQVARTNRVLLSPFRDGTFRYTALANDPANGITAGQIVTVNVLTGANLNLTPPANQTSFNNAGGILPVDSVVLSRILNKMPSVGNLAVDNGGLTQQLRYNVGFNQERPTYTARLDFNINDRNNLSFVYKQNDNALERPDFDTGGYGVTPFTDNINRPRFFTVGYRTSLGDNFSNDLRFGFSSDKGNFNQNGDLGNFIIQGAVLPFNMTNPEPTAEAQGRSYRQETYRDDAVYTFGNHAIRFGGQIERQKIVSFNDGGTHPTYLFTTVNNPRTPRLASALFKGGISAAERTRADTLRYFLGGVIGAGAVQANATSGTSGPVIGARNIEDLRYAVIGGYVSDQWRVTPELTINFGARYELFTPINNPDRLFLEPFIPAGVNVRDAILDPTGSYDIIGTSQGHPGRFFRADTNNIAPQFSVAYSPHASSGLLGTILGDAKTTIRGGYRMSFVNDEYLKSALNAARGNAGLNITVADLDGTTPNLNRRLRNITGSGFPAPVSLTAPFTFFDANQADPNFFNTVFAVDPEMQVGRVHEFNVGFQRDIGWQTAVEIRYVGGRSSNMIRSFDLNQIDIRGTGFAADFLRAQRNFVLSGNVSGAFNPAIVGSQPLPVFDQLPFGAFLDNSAVTTHLINGTPADLANIYIINGLDIDPATGAGVHFRRNPFAGPVDLLSNMGKYRYDALQAEVRRRFANGFSFQANYTFQKSLTDVPEDDQNRFDPLLDIENPQLEYSRADFDRTHTFNFNSIYQLPFGKGKMFLNKGGWVDALFGGFQLTSIMTISSGAPISIRDPRGTLNRVGRSPRQTAFSNLTTAQIKDLIGIFRTPNGIFFINPAVIAPDGTATGGNLGSTPTAAFPGQVFFNAQPGQTGNLPRAFINGPKYINVDVGFAKNIHFGETMKLQLRAEAFNVFNRANFFAPTGVADGSTGENSNIFNINSTTFGRITGTYTPRILQFGVRFDF